MAEASPAASSSSSGLTYDGPLPRLRLVTPPRAAAGAGNAGSRLPSSPRLSLTAHESPTARARARKARKREELRQAIAQAQPQDLEESSPEPWERDSDTDARQARAASRSSSANEYASALS